MSDEAKKELKRQLAAARKSKDLAPSDSLTVFEAAMRTMDAQQHHSPEPTLLGDGMMMVYTPSPFPPIEVKWTPPDPTTWITDLPERPRHRPRMITIVWPQPRRMHCGKWRAAGKVYQTKALAWRGLEKRGLRP